MRHYVERKMSAADCERAADACAAYAEVEEAGNPYTVSRAVGRGYLALKGYEVLGMADTVGEVALICAVDAIAGYPDAAPDVIYDVAAETGQMVGNVKHMRWFVLAVADAIHGELTDESTAAT